MRKSGRGRGLGDCRCGGGWSFWFFQKGGIEREREGISIELLNINMMMF